MPPGLRVHGGISLALREQLRSRGIPLLDLSANLSPVGPAPAVMQALAGVQVAAYPDPAASAARAALANHFHSRPEHFAVGNGAAELLWSLVVALADPGDKVLVVEPTFGEFSAATERWGCCLRTLRLDEGQGFALGLEDLSAALSDHGPVLVYLCAPNNPTGGGVSLAQLGSVCDAFPAVRFVIDQSYLAMSDDHEDLLVPPRSNQILVRSLTKDHGLAGVRVGYLWTGDRHVVCALEGARPSWTASAYAQAAVQACMSQPADAHVTRARATMLDNRVLLVRALGALGLPVVDSRTGFLLVRVGDAARASARLLEQGVGVRDCTSFGLPHHVRLAAPAPQHLARVVQALARVLPR